MQLPHFTHRPSGTRLSVEGRGARGPGSRRNQATGLGLRLVGTLEVFGLPIDSEQRFYSLSLFVLALVVGGVMNLPAEAAKMGMPPAWMGYIHADDTDAATASVKKSGGKVHREPWDIPGVGRFSVVADPQGAHLAGWLLDHLPARRTRRRRAQIPKGRQ